MAKVTAPLFGFSAAGQLGKSIVNAQWRGRPYVRRYVIPANPRTTAQQETRGIFSFLQSAWKLLPTDVVTNWTLFAKGQPLTDRNVFTKTNLPALMGQTDLNFITLGDGAKGGLPAAAMAPTPGSGSITTTLTAPTLPTGWTITKAIVAAMLDGDPNTSPAIEVVSGEDTTSPYSVALTGLQHSKVYQVRGWFQYAKPDGSPAYGPELAAQATTT